MANGNQDAQAQREAASKEKRGYVRELLQGNPRLDDRTLGKLVESKFGSGLARRNMDEVRHAMGWTWKGTGRGRQLVQLNAANTNSEPAAPATTTAPAQQAVKPQPPLTADEQLEVDLIAQLQALMQRQGYQTITIPAVGTAHIRMLVVREKIPGEHVEAQVMHA